MEGYSSTFNRATAAVYVQMTPAGHDVLVGQSREQKVLEKVMRITPLHAHLQWITTAMFCLRYCHSSAGPLD
jgi:hypothetical protein